MTNTISTISLDDGNFFELQGKLFCNLGFNNRFSGLIFEQSFGQLFEGLAGTAVSYVFSDAQDMDFQFMNYFLLIKSIKTQCRNPLLVLHSPPTCLESLVEFNQLVGQPDTLPFPSFALLLL